MHYRSILVLQQRTLFSWSIGENTIELKKSSLETDIALASCTLNALPQQVLQTSSQMFAWSSWQREVISSVMRSEMFLPRRENQDFSSALLISFSRLSSHVAIKILNDFAIFIEYFIILIEVSVCIKIWS